MPDHVHRMIAIPPKYAVSQAMGYQGKERNSPGQCLRRAEAKLRGSTSGPEDYFVSTVGRDEAVIREYIRNQEREEKISDWSR